LIFWLQFLIFIIVTFSILLGHDHLVGLLVMIFEAQRHGLLFALLGCDHLVSLLAMILGGNCCHFFFCFSSSSSPCWFPSCGFSFISLAYFSISFNHEYLIGFPVMVPSIHYHHLFFNSSWFLLPSNSLRLSL